MAEKDSERSGKNTSLEKKKMKGQVEKQMRGSEQPLCQVNDEALNKGHPSQSHAVSKDRNSGIRHFSSGRRKAESQEKFASRTPFETLARLKSA
jgi:hypothetical protein